MKCLKNRDEFETLMYLVMKSHYYAIYGEETLYIKKSKVKYKHHSIYLPFQINGVDIILRND